MSRSPRLYPELPEDDSFDSQNDTFSTSRSYDFDSHEHLCFSNSDETHDSKELTPRLRSSHQRNLNNSTFRTSPQSSVTPKPGNCYCDARRSGVLEHYAIHIVLVVMILLLSVLLFVLLRQGTHLDRRKLNYENFYDLLREQKMIFPSQRRDTWRTLLSVGRHVLSNSTPEYPGTVMFASQTSNKHVSDCLLRNIRQFFESGITRDRTLEVNIAKLKTHGHLQQKVKLNQNLESALLSVSPFISIPNFESLSPESAMLFHSYCDSSNAPYKEVFFILQVNVKDDFTQTLSEKSTEDYLRSLWEPILGEDKTSALLSRVANNIAIIEHEDKIIIDKYCSL